VEHEITEVTSGYRLVLTYNLINTVPTKPAKVPTGLAEKTKELEEALLFWKHNYKRNASDCPGVLAYILHHRYKRGTLSYSRLKGGDRVTGLCLSELCKKHGFVFYLAELDRTVCGELENTGYCDRHCAFMFRWGDDNEGPDIYHFTKIIWERLSLDSIVELDGAKLLDEVPFNKLQIVQDDHFTDGPYEQADDSSEWCGCNNYHRTVSPSS
jgi:hypothetical protein